MMTGTSDASPCHGYFVALGQTLQELTQALRQLSADIHELQGTTQGLDARLSDLETELEGAILAAEP